MPIPFDKRRWAAIQKVLDPVIDLPKQNQLDQLKLLCGNDVGLYQDAKELLTQNDGHFTFLERPAVDLLQKQSAEEKASGISVGEHVGQYQIKEKIGHGGMGAVYRAERSRGDFEQQVAIKVLVNWHAREVQQARFNHEQALLARLEHPNIARLYDAGVSESGQPYLIMEYVQGVQINHYSDAHNLSIEQRLALITQIGRALSYAHSHLIVHRDIKPSNILVNEKGDVKLLDFGVAKLLDDSHLDLTRTGDQVMTPGFASPEQFQNQSVTVATDIYQLGLLSYELLTGRKAFQDQSEHFADFVKQVCEGEPTRPSKVVNLGTEAEQTEIAKRRNSDPSKLSREFSGEIDSIVLKMLAPKPADRYSSLEALIGDLCARSEHRPISAHPQSFTYRGKKLIRRQWRTIAIVGAFIILLGLYAVTTAIQARKIEQALDASIVEQQKAQSVADFMVNIFKGADPNVAGLESISAQQLLERGEQKIIVDLSAAPEIQGHLLRTLGEIYYSQGDSAKSLALLQQALAQQRGSNSGNPLALADTLTQLGVVHATTNDYVQAEAHFIEAEGLFQSTEQQNDLSRNTNYAELINAYGALRLRQGDLESAKRQFERAIGILRQPGIEPSDELAVALNNMAHFHTLSGQLNDAKRVMQEAIRIHEKSLGEQHSYFSVYLVNYGNLLTKLGQFDEAATVFARALKLQMDLLGEQHPYVLNTLRNLGSLAYEQGNLLAAEQYLRRAMAIQSSMQLSDRMLVATLHKQLGQVLSAQLRFSEATHHFERMQAMYSELNVGSHMRNMGLCSFAQHWFFQGNFERAWDLFQQASQLPLSSHLQNSVALLGLARIKFEQNQLVEAMSLANSALEIRAAELSENHADLVEAKAVVALIENQSNNSNEVTARSLSSLLTQLAETPRHSYGGSRALLQQVRTALNAARP